MITAWYDRYLKGLDTGVEDWPVAQVQDSLGRWRAESDFPLGRGDTGQLALSRDGALGTEQPTGRTTFGEGDDAA